MPARLGFQVHGLFDYYGDEKIHMIAVRDQTNNETGGFLVEINGGASSNNVILSFESLINQPINFHIEIFAASKEIIQLWIWF